LYVEELIGPNTVNTTPPATLEAFGDHGQARASLEENVAEANRVMTTLGQVGVSMQDVTDELLRDAVRLFSEPFDKLLETIQRQCADLRA
jgi:transaldolase/glucose-6-phosphate isomerase